MKLFSLQKIEILSVKLLLPIAFFIKGICCGVKLSSFLTSILIRGNHVVLEMDQRPYGLCCMYVKCQPHLEYR